MSTLSESDLSEQLLQSARDDASLARMSEPVECEDVSSIDYLLAPRFGVVQCKIDGSTKVRAVDHFSWSRFRFDKRRQKAESVNGTFDTDEKVRHDSLNALEKYMRMFWMIVGVVPGLFKIDIDSAYRRIPARPEDRWASGIAFRHNARTFVAQHFAMPFGASASNIAWDRIGALLAHLSRRLLKIGTLRYVDDYFGPERPGTMKHATECMARLFRALLGVASVAIKKMEWGAKLIILGIVVEPCAVGVKCVPSPDKVRKWVHDMKTALASGVLTPADATRFVGRLQWAASAMFRKFGRAMIRPIIDQTRRLDGRIDHGNNTELRRAILWWIGIFELELCETRLWAVVSVKVVHLFCDARGSPAHAAAVLLSDDACWWTSMAISDDVLQYFRSRRDNQIMGLELLAITLGMCTFHEMLVGCRVVIHSDNTGSEVVCLM